MEIEKTFEGKIPATYAKLTPHGKEALQAYWKSVDKVREGVRQLKPLRTTRTPASRRGYCLLVAAAGVMLTLPCGAARQDEPTEQSE